MMTPLDLEPVCCFAHHAPTETQDYIHKDSRQIIRDARTQAIGHINVQLES